MILWMKMCRQKCKVAIRRLLFFPPVSYLATQLGPRLYGIDGRMINECGAAGETKVLGENLSYCHFVPHKV
jgi:hypothetical protein